MAPAVSDRPADPEGHAGAVVAPGAGLGLRTAAREPTAAPPGERLRCVGEEAPHLEKGVVGRPALVPVASRDALEVSQVLVDEVVRGEEEGLDVGADGRVGREAVRGETLRAERDNSAVSNEKFSPCQLRPLAGGEPTLSLKCETNRRESGLGRSGRPPTSAPGPRT